MKNIQEAIVAIAGAWEQAWNCHDFSSVKQFIAKDAHWISVCDNHWHGPKEILKVHTELHKDALRLTRWRNNEVMCERAAPGVVLAHIHWIVENLNELNEVTSSRQGMFTWTLVKKTNDWLIASCQEKNLSS